MLNVFIAMTCRKYMHTCKSSEEKERDEKEDYVYINDRCSCRCWLIMLLVPIFF